MAKAVPVCRECGVLMPDAAPRKRYCSAACKSKFHRAAPNPERRTSNPDGQALETTEPEYIKQARALAEAQLSRVGRLEDEVREIIREEIRDNVQDHVKEKVLAAADIMTGLLPLAMARLAQDLDSPLWNERSRAYGLLLRYALPFGEADEGKTPPRIIVEHSIPGAHSDEVIIVDAPDGEPEQRFVELAAGPTVTDPPEGVEREVWEQDWPTCARCHEVRHPGTGSFVALHPNRDLEFVCKSCEYRQQWVRRGEPDAQP